VAFLTEESEKSGAIQNDRSNDTSSESTSTDQRCPSPESQPFVLRAWR
jgi:hypothetical protein